MGPEAHSDALHPKATTQVSSMGSVATKLFQPVRAQYHGWSDPDTQPQLTAFDRLSEELQSNDPTVSD